MTTDTDRLVLALTPRHNPEARARRVRQFADEVARESGSDVLHAIVTTVERHIVLTSPLPRS